MTRFSEQLEHYILRSDLTESQLARVSGFTRSYIALMKNGQRLSPDTDKMDKLLRSLNLSSYEYANLWEEYVRARIGNDAYERNKAIITFIESFGSVSHLGAGTTGSHTIPDVRALDNRMDTEYVLRAAIEAESQKKGGVFRLIMQADVDVLAAALPLALKNNPEFTVEHILCLENQTGSGFEKHQLYNVRQLQHTMRTAVYSGLGNYHIFYYYDRVQAHLNESSLFPYMALTDSMVISMDVGLEHAVVFREKEVVDLCKRLFEEQKKRCRPLLSMLENESDWVRRYMLQEVSGDVCYTFAQQPCFGALNVADLVKKYAAAELSRYAHLTEQHLKSADEHLARGDIRYVCYCTREGLKRFAHEGLVDELPRDAYRPLEKPDRLALLRKLRDAAAKKRYEIYLIPEHAIAMPRELYLIVPGLSEATFLYLSERGRGRTPFLLKEGSLTRLFLEFLESYRNSSQLISAEETICYIDSLIQNLSNS